MLNLSQMPAALSWRDLNEVCRNCHQRRGEHQYFLSDRCRPEASSTTFLGSGRYQDAPAWEKTRRGLLERKLKGAIPCYRRERKPDGTIIWRYAGDRAKEYQ